MPYVSLCITFVLVMYSVYRTGEPDNCRAIEFPQCPTKPQGARHKTEDIGGWGGNVIWK